MGKRATWKPAMSDTHHYAARKHDQSLRTQKKQKIRLNDFKTLSNKRHVVFHDPVKGDWLVARRLSVMTRALSKFDNELKNGDAAERAENKEINAAFDEIILSRLQGDVKLFHKLYLSIGVVPASRSDGSFIKGQEHRRIAVAADQGLKNIAANRKAALKYLSEPAGEDIIDPHMCDSIRFYHQNPLSIIPIDGADLFYIEQLFLKEVEDSPELFTKELSPFKLDGPADKAIATHMGTQHTRLIYNKLLLLKGLPLIKEIDLLISWFFANLWKRFGHTPGKPASEG